MQIFFAQTGFLRHFVAQILLCVFIALSFLPAGFMPNFSKDGVSVKLCSGLDEKIALVGDDGQPVDHQDQTPCAFGLNFTPVPSVQAVLIPAPVYDAAQYNVQEDIVLARIIATSGLSRAPPVTL